MSRAMFDLKGFKEINYFQQQCSIQLLSEAALELLLLDIKEYVHHKKVHLAGAVLEGSAGI